MGLAIRGAEIEFQTKGDSYRTTSDDQGAFNIPNVTDSGALLVRQPGFAPASTELTADRLAETVEVRLYPAPDVQRITVSATGDERIPALPSGQCIISRQQSQVSGSLVLD